MMMRATISIALLALAACAPTGTGVRVGGGTQTGADLSIRSEIDFSSLPTEGELGTFEVRLGNASKKYVVLRDLIEPGVGPLITWQVSRSGTLTFDARSARFEYDGTKPTGEPRPAFNVAFLCPGEEITIRPRIRLLRLPRRFLINYFTMELADVSANVYFESKEGGKLGYKRLFGTDLDLELVPRVPKLQTNEKPVPLPAVASVRTVVFPHAETILTAPLQEKVDLGIRLDNQAFRLADAAAKAGTTVEQIGPLYTYWAAVNAWVFRGPQGPVMVNQKGMQELPEISDPDAFFYLLDTLGSGSITFTIRSPLEWHFNEKATFRLLPKPCAKCGALVRRSGEKPPTRCDNCKAWLLIVPAACKACKEKIDMSGAALPVRCATCKEPIAVAEDAYKFQIHAGRLDISRLLKFVADQKFRIDVTSDAAGPRLNIRR